jgi:hypothetical protein
LSPPAAFRQAHYDDGGPSTPGQLHTLLTAGSVTVHALDPVTSAADLAHRRNACPGRHSVTSSPSPTDS